MKLAVALALAGGAAALRPAARATRATVRMGAEPLSQQTGKYAMDQAVLDKYAALPRDKIQAEYVFIDADCTARSKWCILTGPPRSTLQLQERLGSDDIGR